MCIIVIYICVSHHIFPLFYKEPKAACKDPVTETTTLANPAVPDREDQQNVFEFHEENAVTISTQTQVPDDNLATVGANEQPVVTTESTSPDADQADPSAAPPAGATAALGTPTAAEPTTDANPTTEEPIATTRPPVFSERKQS